VAEDGLLALPDALQLLDVVLVLAEVLALLGSPQGGGVLAEPGLFAV
jgi:hypothetical protein